MKSKKKCTIFSLIFTVLVLVVVMLLFSNPPIGIIRSDTLYDYGRCESFVFSCIEEYYADILPKYIPDSCEVNKFSFEYSCSLFGNPNFYILLNQQYSKAEFDKEIDRIQSFNPTTTFSTKESQYLIVTGALSDISSITDSEILDGTFYTVEIAKVNKSTLCIEYFVLYQWDASPVSENISMFLYPLIQGDSSMS